MKNNKLRVARTSLVTDVARRPGARRNGKASPRIWPRSAHTALNQEPQRPSVPSEWRELAEQKRKSQPPESGYRPSWAQTARLVEELKIHEIELEMQNEALLPKPFDLETLDKAVRL
jgi:hypothetical protein